MKLKVVFLILLLSSLFLNLQFTYRIFKENRVERVIDGDTFVLNGQRVRLLGVNAPELQSCMGEAAKSFLEKRVFNKTMMLSEKTRDNYGRILAVVHVVEPGLVLGSESVNEELVKNGLGVLEYTAKSINQKLKQNAEYAKKMKFGIYSPACLLVKPQQSNCLIKGNIDQSSGRKYYHLPKCSHYNEVVLNSALGEKWFCTESEAQKEGFVKGQGCGK